MTIGLISPDYLLAPKGVASDANNFSAIKPIFI
jgi:hypothetical protein